MAQSYAQQVIADGAIAYWRLDETSGASAFSRVGGYTGTISGGVTLNQPGALADGDAAMGFTGGYVDAGNVAAFNFGAASYTIEAWLNRSAGGGFQVPVGKGSGAGSGWRAFIVSSGGITLYWGTDSQHYQGGLQIVPVGGWHHAIWGYDATAGAVFYAVDGVYQSIVTANQPVTNTDPFRIGITANGTYPFPGSIDEVAIYPTALTPAQIATHYTLARTAKLAATTLAGPLGKNDVYALLGATSGLADKSFLLIGQELCACIGAPVGPQVQLRRGLEGTLWAAHAAGEPVALGLGTDFPGPLPGDDTAYGGDAQARPPLATTSYNASGAMLPLTGGASLVGGSPLAMTLAVPAPSLAGPLTITSTAGVAHTITIPGWGVGTTHVITFPAYPTAVILQASQGTWLPLALGGATVA